MKITKSKLKEFIRAELAEAEGTVFTIFNIKYDAPSSIASELPKKIEIVVPPDIQDSYEADEYISDYISNETGYTHKGFDTNPDVYDVMGEGIKQMKLTKSKLKQIIKEEFSQMSGEANLGGNPSRLRPLNEQDFYEDVEGGLWDLFEKTKETYSYGDSSPEENKQMNQDFVQALQDFGEKVIQSRG